MTGRLVTRKNKSEKRYMNSLYQLFVETGIESIIIDEISDDFFNDCIDFGLKEGLLEYSGDIFILREKENQDYNARTYSLTDEGEDYFNFLRYFTN